MPGAVPLWSQEGGFVITVGAMKVRIGLEGVFSIGSGFSYWPGFAAHAVDDDRLLLSETGYRSFSASMPIRFPPSRPMISRARSSHVARELKGRLVSIAAGYRGKDAS